VPFVSVVPIIVPLCSIYLWCNQNVFKRISQWINTIYSGKFNASTTNCSLGIFAKSLDGLPRAWVCHPNPLRHYGNRLSEKSESFFVCLNLLLAKCYSGLLRTGFATPTRSANYGNRLSEKSESFLFLKSLHHRENFIDKHP